MFRDFDGLLFLCVVVLMGVVIVEFFGVIFGWYWLWKCFFVLNLVVF